jgi:glycosyltransferase involved in cell wall biosynthesis
MKSELVADFGVAEEKVTIIPFGINDTLPNTKLTSAEAKEALGVGAGHKTLLFFGRIAPYKGLDYLIAALGCLTKRDGSYRLLIAGIIKDCLPFWRDIQQAIDREGVRDKIIESIEFIPDEKVELYFKAADVLVLPYTDIFQSGVLFLAYSFGLPAIVTDVGSMKEEIIAGKTGFACRAQDPDDLARAVMTYFASDLFENLEPQRQAIQSYANERYSWDKVGGITKRVYSQLAQNGKATRRAGAVRK